jgi:hypothetical protein
MDAAALGPQRNEVTDCGHTIHEIVKVAVLVDYEANEVIVRVPVLYFCANLSGLWHALFDTPPEGRSFGPSPDALQEVGEVPRGLDCVRVVAPQRPFAALEGSPVQHFRFAVVTSPLKDHSQVARGLQAVLVSAAQGFLARLQGPAM